MKEPLKPILKSSQKRVKFSIDENNGLNGFLSKLKKKSLDNEKLDSTKIENQNINIIGKLDTIVLKMNEIIELLKENKNKKQNEIENKVENLVLDAI